MPLQIARKRATALASHASSNISLTEGREILRGWAAKLSTQRRLEFARSFGHALVQAWWSQKIINIGKTVELRRLIQPFRVAKLSIEQQELAGALGALLANLEAEQAAYDIGRIYTGVLPDEHRSAHGIYYTPPSLTSRLIAQATNAGVNWANCRVLDPACGGGAFLAPIAQKIIDELPNCEPRILLENIASRLRGYELDEFGAWLSQVTLDVVVLPITKRTGARLPVIVSVCDTLRQSEVGEQFDLVIGNPPYGRVTLNKSDRQEFSRSLFGHANLYGLFTDIALRRTKPGGVVAYVTPTSFLAGEYFKNLRKLLGQQACPVAIDFVSIRKGVFDDVLQETLLVTYRNATTGSGVKVSEITPNTPTSVAVDSIGKFNLPTEPSQPWILPRTPKQAALVKILTKMTGRLQDWGYAVSTGPLVWNRYKQQLSNQPGERRYPLIWAEAVTSDGDFEWKADKKNHSLYFKAMRGDDWLIMEKPCVLLQRTTAKEQSRRLIAAALPASFLKKHSAVVVENHLNMLLPAGDVKISAAALAAFLNSEAADNAFRCLSGSVAVSAYEIESLPLPSVVAMQGLESLVKKKSSKKDIEAYCLRMYSGII